MRTQISIKREDDLQAWIDVADRPFDRAIARDGRPYLIHNLNLGALPHWAIYPSIATGPVAS
ncbi:MAG: hypothetical protein WDN06_10795 [Asticcacaulis sp.]